MSAKIRKAVWQDSKQKGSRLLLLLAIADLADDEGVASAPVSDLAKMTRLSERCVQYMFTRLERSQELVVERRPGGCNLFRVQEVQSLHPSKLCTGANVLHPSPANFAPLPERKKEPKKESTNNIPLPIHISNPEDSQQKPAARDIAFDIFIEVFSDLNGPAPYMGPETPDFVQLNRLRKKLQLPNLEAPEFWLETCRNYLGSPHRKHTLADLCTCYATYYKGPVDRFNKPLGGDNGLGQNRNEQNRRTAREIGARFNNPNGGSGERGAREGHHGDLHGTLGPSLFGADPASDKPDD